MTYQEFPDFPAQQKCGDTANTYGAGNDLDLDLLQRGWVANNFIFFKLNMLHQSQLTTLHD